MARYGLVDAGLEWSVAASGWKTAWQTPPWQAMLAAARSIFSRLDVLGIQRLEYELTPDAIDLGLDAALPPVMRLEYQIGEFGRGERDSASLTQRPGPFLLINRTPPREAAVKETA
jgi:hypothetical protein